MLFRSVENEKEGQDLVHRILFVWAPEVDEEEWGEEAFFIWAVVRFG